MDNKNIKGADQTIRNLSNYSKRVVTELVAGCQAVQAKVVNDARAIVPVVTRNLQGSIQEGEILIEDDNITAIVAANAEYASYVEGVPDEQGRYGRGIKTPFLRPALFANQNTFVRAMAAAVKRAEAGL